MTKITVLLLTSMALVGLWAGCGGGESKEDIATGVAREWVNTSTGLVSEATVELIVGEKPALTQLAGGIIADQIRENLSWTYSVPKEESEDRYSVTATAVADLKIGIPLLGEKAYSVSAPFNLEIDTDARAVSDWSLDLLSARVEER